MSTPPSLRQSMEQHLASLGRIVDAADTIVQISQAVQRALDSGNKVLTCGNGGSAAEALHLAEEMMGRFSRDRPPMAAVCLAADPAALTCIANDYGYEEVFARQVAGLGRAGDVLVALSTSGKSPNILKALRQARELGLTNIGFLGKPGSPAESLCDVALTTQASHSAHIQEIHLVVVHLLLEYLDERA